VVSDVAIVGAGPAGSALAMELGRQGLRVTLYERSRGPCLKACGEGLLPHGVAALHAIAGLPDVPRVQGLRFVAGGVSVEADFQEGFGLIVRRDRFDAWLREKAGATPNVDLRMGTPYRPNGERMVVGADGKRSIFHRRLPARSSAPRRVGLSTHVGGVEGLGSRVEVFFHTDGELYLAPTGGGE
jgi:flavin-dependent dehydrogenase